MRPTRDVRLPVASASGTAPEPELQCGAVPEPEIAVAEVEVVDKPEWKTAPPHEWHAAGWN